MNIRCGILACLLLFSALVRGQEAPKREIGLRISPGNLGNIGFIYKKQLADNTYRRYRLATGNLSVSGVSNNVTIGFGVGGAIGKEKRRSIDDRLSFIYGHELIASLGLASLSSGNVTIDNGNGSTVTVTGSNVLLVTPSIGVGLVLGAQYTINPRWYVSAELIPTVTLSGTFGSAATMYNLRGNFDSSSVGLTGAYRF